MKTDHSSLTYLKWFAFPVLAFLAAAIPLNLYFEPIAGDLTRIGRWAERDYGWNRQQPSVTVQANGSSVRGPQVLVLGDSFSHPNIWQSLLAESRHLEILSFQYEDVGCVDNWLQWVKEKHYPSANTIVIETVERSFIALFKFRNSCGKLLPKSFEMAEKTVTPVRPQRGLTLDATYLLPTAVNSLHVAIMKVGRVTSGETVNVPLVTNTLFSNRRSDRLLYYSDDDLKLGWSESDIAAAIKNLKRIQADLEARGFRLVVIVVPDKSSVYRPFMADKADNRGFPDIFRQLQVARVNNVDLLGFFREEASETVDLYLPNDTHLSTQGYKLMAAKVADEAF
jgi:hypothetical protein